MVLISVSVTCRFKDVIFQTGWCYLSTLRVRNVQWILMEKEVLIYVSPILIGCFAKRLIVGKRKRQQFAHG